jgi:magnesium transporter
VSLDIVAGPGVIATIHDGASQVVEDAFEQLQGESRLGALDAGSMLAILVDVGLSSYFRQVEEIERTIDELDELVLGPTRESEQVLERLADTRHRLAIVRRTLSPHREAFSPFGRPDFELHEELGRPWPGLIDRLGQAILAVENAWTLLVGSFDIYIGRAAQRSNDVMKVLTLLSAVLLPAVVLAGIFGMNFKLPIFDRAENIWLIVGAMVVLAATILLGARWRGWL